MNIDSSLPGSELLEDTALAVLCAGVMAADMRKSMKAYSAKLKSQGNFVTQADTFIEAFLKIKLQAISDTAGFLAEESGDDRCDGDYWTIDPIDGTGNYLFGLPYSVCVSYQRDGDTLIGFVYDPGADELWWGLRDGGAYLLSNASEAIGREDISSLEGSLPLTVPDTIQNEGNVIFGMPYDRTKAHRILSYVEALFSVSSDLKRIGPASLDVCRVAFGKAKLYIELDLKPWDYYAAELILREAGGASLHAGDVSLFGTAGSLAEAREILGMTQLEQE